MSEQPEYRTVTVLSKGARVSVLVAAALLVVAAYWYWVPIQFTSNDGSQFRCGSAASPPVDEFPRNVCGDLNAINGYRALMFAGLATIALVGGLVVFGTTRRRDLRRHEPDDEPPL